MTNPTDHKRTYAYQRGYSDGAHERPSLFIARRHGIDAQSGDPMADDWSRDMREAYLAGYESGYLERAE